MSDARFNPATWTLATLVVCGLGLVWQAWAIRDLRMELGAVQERLGAVELAAERDRAQKAVTAADRAMRWQKRQARRSGADGDVDTLTALTPRPADSEEWLDELAAALEQFGTDNDVPAEQQDQVLAVFETLIDGSRATRDHLQANHLTHAEARQQMMELHTAAQQDLERILGPELAGELQAYVPRDPRTGTGETEP